MKGMEDFEEELHVEVHMEKRMVELERIKIGRIGEGD